jgi:phosphoribosylglycinamide formyltransferase-1
VRGVTEARVAVLASGEGTNLQALLDDPVVGGWIALVVSDRAGSGALRRARDAGVEALHLDRAALVDPAGFDAALIAALRERRIDVVALAGFLRLLGAEVVRAFEGRLVNVHPALLPSFPGRSSVADALAYGVKVTGVTVHLVDEEMDHGPVIFQEAIAVHDGDDWDALEARVHEVEHRLLPAAVRAIAESRVVVDGRRVRVLERAPA